MYIAEFYKEDQEPDNYHRVFVYTYIELLQLLNYIDKFEYKLEAVTRSDMTIGYEKFKELDNKNSEKKKGRYKNEP